MARDEIEGIKLMLALGFGGILAVATIILFHIGYPGWGILCFVGVFLAWLLDNEKSAPVIAVIFLVGGFIEIGFGNGLGAFILIILALAAFFVPKILE